jgi:hypothetical protein
MGHSVDTYKPLDRGEAFGEQFITITHNLLSECFAPTACIFCLSCQILLLDWLSRRVKTRLPFHLMNPILTLS